MNKYFVVIQTEKDVRSFKSTAQHKFDALNASLRKLSRKEKAELEVAETLLISVELIGPVTDEPSGV